jgi:hypothetical protein
MVDALITLCAELQASPILVATGQEQPRYRTRHVVHAQQTHHDAELELANNLAARLPPYTAFYKSPGRVAKVRLVPYLSAEIDQARIDRVRQRSKGLYGVAVQVVEEDIRRRQAALQAGAANATIPPIGRRPRAA